MVLFKPLPLNIRQFLMTSFFADVHLMKVGGRLGRLTGRPEYSHYLHIGSVLIFKQQVHERKQTLELGQSRKISLLNLNVFLEVSVYLKLHNLVNYSLKTLRNMQTPVCIDYL